MNKWNVAILVAQILVLLASIFLFVPVFSEGLVAQGKGGKEAIALASQIGRLDVVSLIFAMFGIILALLAFVGFFSIRTHVENIASEKASDIANDIVDQKIDLLRSSIITRDEPTRASDIDTGGGEQLTGEDNDSQS